MLIWFDGINFDYVKKVKIIYGIIVAFLIISFANQPKNNQQFDVNRSHLEHRNENETFSMNDIVVNDFLYRNGDEYPDFELVLTKEISDTIEHFFSNNTNKDLFIITLPKGNIQETTANVQIINAQGEILFERSFESFYLLNGYDVMNLKNADDLKKYFVERVIGVFSENKFEKANEIKESYISTMKPKDFLDYESFLVCKKLNQWMFTLTLGEEDNTMYGFIESKGAVELLSCC